jgi:hypothetical protein
VKKNWVTPAGGRWQQTIVEIPGKLRFACDADASKSLTSSKTTSGGRVSSKIR